MWCRLVATEPDFSFNVTAARWSHTDTNNHGSSNIATSLSLLTTIHPTGWLHVWWYPLKVVLSKKWLLLPCEAPWFPFEPSSEIFTVILAPKGKQFEMHIVHNNTKSFWAEENKSRSPWTPVYPLTACSALKCVCSHYGIVCSLSPAGFAPRSEVNHRGLGQFLSSLENSLHMTHFRYPQILKSNKTIKTKTIRSLTMKQNDQILITKVIYVYKEVKLWDTCPIPWLYFIVRRTFKNKVSS